MIVISGVLLLVAVVLLVIGLITTPLAWVYASIAVSVVSFVFLLLGVRQRREAPVAADRPDVTPAPAPAGRLSTLAADDSDVTVVPATTEEPAAAQPQRAAAVAVVDEPEEAAAAPEVPVGADSSTAAGPVLVVPGRPRYHVAGCRYLSGRDVEARSLQDARSEGFTACGVCRPDESLAAGTSDEVATQEIAAATDEPTTAPVEVPEAEEAPAVPARRPRASAKTAPAKSAAATSAPAKRTAAKAAPAKAAPAKSAPAKTTAAKAAAPRKQEKVVVIPDRDKFHLATCRFVRDLPASETEELTKTVARREGFEPCGVCKP